MANILYHSARPLNDNSNGFGEFDSVDFEILDVGRKLMKNSVYIEADLVVHSTGTTEVLAATNIGVNNNIGYHAFFESFSVDAKGQNQQNLQSYPRYVNVVNTASSNIGSVFSPQSQAEGIQVTEEAGRYVCQAVFGDHVDAGHEVTRTAQMCIKPKICLNSMMGDDYSFEKSGAIRLSFNLARNGTALQGGAVTIASNYVLKNIRLRYMTMLDDGTQGAILMNSVTSVKQTMNSEQGNFSVKVPSKAVTGLVVTYISQANETSLTQDSYALEYLPNLDEIVYLFSDSQSKYISYNITDKDDMLALGLEALAAGGVKCKVNSFQARASRNIIHGLNFQSTVDLSSSPLAINLRSSSAKIAADPRNVYMHFLTILEL